MYKFLALSLLALVTVACNGKNPADPHSCGCTDTIFFLSNREGHNQIYRMDLDGSHQRRITQDTLDYYHPQFSPDGTRLLFYSHVEGNDEIFSMDTSGNDLQNLSHTPGNDNLAQFSPDGSRIVFTSDRDGNREIYSMNPDGTDQTRLTENSYPDYCPSFSPDGSQILFYQIRSDENPVEPAPPHPQAGMQYASSLYGSYEIFKMDADGGNLTQLTPDDTYLHLLNFTLDYSINTYAAAPRFAPDGSRIVFTSYTVNLGFDIHMMDADGSHRIRLTTDGAANCEPHFMPDGEKILFRSHRAYAYDLYTMELDGSNLTNLTPDSDHCLFFQFSPDGKYILFGDEIDRTYWYKIFMMDIDGSHRIRLTDNYYHDWYAIFQPAP